MTTERELAERLRQYVNGYQITQAIAVVVTLGVPDRLADEPRNAEELATEAGADARSLYRVLRALASLGILAETSDGAERTFALTDLGRLLRTMCRVRWRVGRSS